MKKQVLRAYYEADTIQGSGVTSLPSCSLYSNEIIGNKQLIKYISKVYTIIDNSAMKK